MEVGPFLIESEQEADMYLDDLLRDERYRSTYEIELRAAQYIRDKQLKDYFIDRGKAILGAEE